MALWFILGIFTASYVLKSLFCIYSDQFNHYNYSIMLLDLLVGVVCDYLPIMLLLIFHKRNFSEKKRNSVENNEEDQTNLSES